MMQTGDISKGFRQGFKDLVKDNSEEPSVLVELFSKIDILVKSEIISVEEASGYAKYYWLSTHDDMKDTNLKELLDYMLMLRLSLKRRSRREFLEGFKRGDIDTKTQKRGFFERLGFG